MCRNISVKIVFIFSIVLMLAGCSAKQTTSGDSNYESQVITIEGLPQGNGEITVAQLRELEQHQLDASYKRTTGLDEKFKMSGPYLKDVINAVGGNIDDYAGIGVMGKDAYYCLISKEVIESTPDLMIATVIDGKPKLDEIDAPARLAVQGQFGPYWVRGIEKIILYKEVPEKNIKSVWSFDSLAEGIEPYEYEYYGSKDDAIEIEQIFSRLDNVDSKAFFTMKSADGFKKTEAINMVKSRYYIKTEGEDAPTNISPYIKLGMNVKNISWISTNEDAAIFPKQMEKYIELKEIDGKKGMPISEVLYETEVKKIKTEKFDILSTDGEKIRVNGEDLSKGIIYTADDGKTQIVWENGLGYQNIDSLLRIRHVEEISDTEQKTENSNEKDKTDEKDDDKTDSQADISANTNIESADSKEQNEVKNIDKIDKSEDTQNKKDVAFTINGNGVSKDIGFSIEELKSFGNKSIEQVYSISNNWPNKKLCVVKGVDMLYLLEKAGLKDNAQTVKISADDGYSAVFTIKQLKEKRYCYPKIKSNSIEGKYEVKPVLAWKYEDGTDDITKAQDIDLRFMCGQAGLNDANTVVSVQNVCSIEVSTAAPGRWSDAQANISTEKSDGSADITLSHSNMDNIKIYYTTDGTEPNCYSSLYNPSTSYFQPDLTKAVTVPKGTVMKFVAIGYGKENSKIVTVDYK